MKGFWLGLIFSIFGGLITGVVWSIKYDFTLAESSIGALLTMIFINLILFRFEYCEKDAKRSRDEK